MELIDELTNVRGQNSISIYFDCSHGSHDALTFSTRFKNVLREVRGYSGAPQHQELCCRLSALLPDLAQRALQHPGLAVFCSVDRIWTVDLWFTVDDLVCKGERLALRPLLAAWSDPLDYFVLALSQHSVRLIQLHSGGYQTIALDKTAPLDIHAATPTLRGRTLNFHTASTGQAVYHGEDAAARRRDEDEKRFLRAVTDATEKALMEGPANDKTSRGPAPAEAAQSGKTNDTRVIVAAVDALASALRREATDRLPLVQEILSGSPDGLTDLDLARAARPVAERDRKAWQNQTLARVTNDTRHDKVVTDIQDLVSAAADGRVDTLVLAHGTTIWGTFDTETRTVALKDHGDSQAEDLLDVVALETFLKGGAVHVVSPRELHKSPEQAVALLRY